MSGPPGLSVAAKRGHICRQPPMRLAIYQGRWYHSEVFGFVIDVAAACGHSLSIYYSADHPTSAVQLYSALYPGSFDVRPPADFLRQEADFDAVFFTTPDDIPDERLQRANAHRYAYTVHLLDPAYAKEWHILRLHMSPLVAWPFILPAFDGGVPPAASARTKTVMMIGTLWDGTNYETTALYRFAELIAPFGWTLEIFTRHWGTETQGHPDNVVLRMNKGSEEAAEAAKKAAFILIWPAPSSWYVVDRLTGSLPFALSLSTPILTSDRFAAVYNLHEGVGAVVARDVAALAAQLDPAVMTPARHASLISALATWRDAVLEQNGGMVDLLLGSIPGRAQVAPVALPREMERFRKA